MIPFVVRGERTVKATAEVETMASESPGTTYAPARRAAGPGPRAAARARAPRRWTPPAVGALGAVVSFAGSWIPSLWLDEAATLSAARRSLADLGVLAGHLDAVHAVYYAAVHGWVAVFGDSPVSVRLPSALVVGVTAMLLVHLGRRLAGPRLGLAAGLVYCVLPRVTWAGTEARSYALSALMATLVAVTALRAVDRARWPDWVLFAEVCTIAHVVFLYAVLVSLAVTVGCVALARRRRDRVAAAVSFGASAALTLPLYLLVSGQAQQVGWIEPPGRDTVRQVLVGQYFPAYGADLPARELTGSGSLEATIGSVAAAALAWALVVRYCVVRPPGARRVLWFAAPAVVLPVAALLVLSDTDRPLYVPRYLTMTAPFFAILVGAAVAGLRRVAARLGAVALVAALCLPVYVAQRSPLGKHRYDDYAGIAATVHDGARPGDGILFTDPRVREAVSAYPAQLSAVTDVARIDGPARRETVWNIGRPVAEALPDALRHRRIWVVTPVLAPPGGDPVLRQLADRGYRAVSGSSGPAHRVVLLER